MAYTSAQYKYILVRLLQRLISMGNIYDRAYTYNFFYKLFDSSIIVDENSFNGFIKAMDENVVVLAEKNFYYASSLQGYIGKGEHGELLLVDAFAAIGITLKFSDNVARFTKPNGSTMEYTVYGYQRDYYQVTKNRNIASDGTNCFYMNVHSYQEYEYAKRASIVFSLKNIDVLDAESIMPNVCGVNVYWNYNKERKEQTITGDGIFAGVTDEEQLGAGVYTTIIFSSTVNELLDGSVRIKGESYKDSQNKTQYYPGKCVFLHAENADIKITKEFCKSNYRQKKWDTTTIYPQIVYTDCKKIIDELTGLDYITLKPLSEWEG